MGVKLNPHPGYTMTDVPWLGEIPKHWKIINGGSILSKKREKNIGMIENTVLSLSYGRIVVKPPEKLHGLVPESFETYQIVNPLDIIIRPTDLQNDWVTIRVAISYTRGIITSAYICMQAKKPITAEYAYYLLLAYDLKKVFYGMGSGLRQNLDWSDIKKLPMLTPPQKEQDQIVQFLDNKLLKINKFMKNKKKLIELLKEKKQSTINQAVTKGLDPNAKMKPSGVEWLGNVPERWECKALKHFVLNLNHKRVPLSSTQRGEMKLKLYDYYGASGVIDKVDNYIFDEELLLIAEDGANLVLRNLPLLIIAKGKYWVNNHAHILKPINSEIRFLAYYLETINYQPWISGAAQPKLTKDRLMSITISVPKLEDQIKIVDYIKENTKDNDLIIKKTTKEIELITEYRTTLISDVVTGQVDVRDVHIEEPQEVLEEQLEAMNEELPVEQEIPESEAI